MDTLLQVLVVVVIAVLSPVAVVCAGVALLLAVGFLLFSGAIILAPIYLLLRAWTRRLRRH